MFDNLKQLKSIPLLINVNICDIWTKSIITPQQYVDFAAEHGLSSIFFINYFSTRYFNDLQELAAKKNILVFPGVSLTISAEDGSLFDLTILPHNIESLLKINFFLLDYSKPKPILLTELRKLFAAKLTYLFHISALVDNSKKRIVDYVRSRCFNNSISGSVIYFYFYSSDNWNIVTKFNKNYDLIFFDKVDFLYEYETEIAKVLFSLRANVNDILHQNKLFNQHSSWYNIANSAKKEITLSCSGIKKILNNLSGWQLNNLLIDHLEIDNKITNVSEMRNKLNILITNKYKSNLRLQTKFKKNNYYKQRLNYELSFLKKDSELLFLFFVAFQSIRLLSRSLNNCDYVARGSVNASLIAYIIGITDVDPVHYKLPFESFYFENRRPLPDIDLDVRSDIWVTVSTTLWRSFISRAAIENKFLFSDVLKKTLLMHNAGYSDINNAINDILIKIKDEHSLSIAEKKKLNIISPVCFEISSRISKLVKQYILHNSKFIFILKNNLLYLPASRAEINLKQINAAEKSNRYFIYLTHLTNIALKKINVIKLDVLSSRIAQFIFDVLKFINLTTEEISYKIGNRTDSKVFQLLSNNSKWLGLFQLTGSKLSKKLIKYFRVNNFNDLVIFISLIRPSFAYRQRVNQYISKQSFENFADWLLFLNKNNIVWSKNNWTPIFKEQLLLFFHDTLNLSWNTSYKILKLKTDGYTDTIPANVILVKRLEKKLLDFVRLHRVLDEKWVKQFLNEEIIKTKGYLFNRSHAICYAQLTYQCAWLKTYFKEQFYIVLFRYISKKKRPLFFSELKLERWNLKMFLVNDERAYGDKIVFNGRDVYFPLIFLNLNFTFVQKIIAEYKARKTFTSFGNLFYRLGEKHSKSEVFKILIGSGFFSEFEKNSARLIAGYEILCQFASIFWFKGANLDERPNISFAAISKDNLRWCQHSKNVLFFSDDDVEVK